MEVLKEETQKSLKELQENTTKQVKELNKTMQDLKMKVETKRKSKKGNNCGDRKPRILGRYYADSKRTQMPT